MALLRSNTQRHVLGSPCGAVELCSHPELSPRSLRLTGRRNQRKAQSRTLVQTEEGYYYVARMAPMAPAPTQTPMWGAGLGSIGWVNQGVYLGMYYSVSLM
jgi:hypothetical protein